MTAVTEAENSIGSSFRTGGRSIPSARPLLERRFPFCTAQRSSVRCEPNNAANEFRFAAPSTISFSGSRNNFKRSRCRWQKGGIAGSRLHSLAAAETQSRRCYGLGVAPKHEARAGPAKKVRRFLEGTKG